MARVGCVDFGLARIGLAVSDVNQIIATSLGIIPTAKTTETTAKEVLAAFAEYRIEKLVVGFPLHLSGKKGFLSDEVSYFMRQLELFGNIQVVAWDERLSTRQAERVLKEANMCRKKRVKFIDALSAVILLQNFLDSLSEKSYL